MKKKKLSFTKSLLYALEIGLIFSFSFAYMELSQNFPERLSDSFWRNIRVIIDYWFGWVIGFIWLYLIAFTVVIGFVIHGIKLFWRRVFEFPK